MKLGLTAIVSLFLATASHSGYAGNDNGHGDLTITPAEKIGFPAESVAKNKLDEMANWFPEVANAIADTFEVCEAFKIQKDHPQGRYAEIIALESGKCRVYYYAKFFKAGLSANDQAEVTLHEAVHYALRSDPKSDDPQSDIYIQDIGRKIMAANWQKDAFAFENVVDTWKFSQPERSFHNLPVEEIAKVLSQKNAFQFPNPAKENYATEMSHNIEVVRYELDSKKVPGVCITEIAKVLSQYQHPLELTVSEKGVLFSSADGDTTMRLRTGKFDKSFHREFMETLISDAIRAEVDAVGRFHDTFDGGQYCQFDLYDTGAEVVGVELFVLVPPVKERSVNHKSHRARKAMVIALEYVHS